MILKPEHCPECGAYPEVSIRSTLGSGADWCVRCETLPPKCNFWDKGIGATRTRAVKAYNKACALYRRDSARKAKSETRKKGKR